MKKLLFMLPILSILLTGLVMTSNACTHKDLSMSNINTGNTIYNFRNTTHSNRWEIVNDGVMGGMSLGQFKLDEDGFGIFSGNVSLENNGGFTSLRYRFSAMSINDEISKVIIRVKGDGKRYQLRLKEEISDKQAYITHFETTGDWQTIEVPLNSMYPTFRGMKLPLANFKKSKISEVSFLISNKKQESFELVIDSIILQ